MTNTIKDSGNRTVFATGSVRDIQEGKGRMDLLPHLAIIEVSKHCEAGANKYGEHNVDYGISVNCVCHFADSQIGQNVKWDDDIDLNRCNCPTSAWEKYFEQPEKKL